MPTINEKTKNLYIAINNVVSEIGKEGQIDSRHKLTEELMHALFYIDGGEYKPELLDTPDDALTKDAEPEPIGYMQKVIEALYENGDPVSIDAAELLERVSTVTTQWQPIDTAPKENGARVLLFGYAATYGGSADLKQPIIRCGRRENNTFSRMVQVEGTDLFRLEDYESDRWINDESYLTDDRLLDPTHWMPLPKPPVKEVQS